MTADPALYPEGLYAQAGWPQTVTLQRCGTATEPAQQWSFDQYSNYRGTSDGRTLNELWLGHHTA
jgi:hypothetical protein